VKLRVALEIGRVSNLPTVTSNVLVGVVLAGGSAPWPAVAVICVAMSLMYVAGMFLNDAFDRDIDAIERPTRPIPSGRVAAAEVFAAGFALLAFGVLGIAGVALSSGAGWGAVGCAVVLAALIVYYDMRHKQNPFAPIVMGGCRVMVYATAALASGGAWTSALLVACGALLAYLIGLTYIARRENRSRLGAMWPLVLLGVPFAVAWPRGDQPWAFALWLLLLLWAVRCVRLAIAGGPNIRTAVTGLIAGIALLDAVQLARADALAATAIAAGAFLLTTLLQRKIAGT
jgi:4-hydroxybenzoate polyprenyltransferase